MDENTFRIILLFHIFTLEEIIYNEVKVIDRRKLTKENPLITLINIHQNLNKKIISKLKNE
jgi:hypothetical protein